MSRVLGGWRVSPVVSGGIVVVLALAGVSVVDRPTAAVELEQSVDVAPAESVDGEDAAPVVGNVSSTSGIPFADSVLDERVEQIEEDGGYSVEVSPISNVLLMAEVGAVPVPYDERVWGPDQQDSSLTDLGADLMELVSAYPENLAEVAFSSDDSFLEVYVKDLEGVGVTEIAKLVEDRGAVGTYEEREDFGRRNDSSPFTMGADIRVCSLGVPVVLWNTYMVVTAAHCGKGKFYTPQEV